MKATVETLNAAPAFDRSRVAVLAELFKARLTSLVLLTTLVGFCMGWSASSDFARLFETLLGTALLAAGAAALNQLIERDLDARMSRTQDRPLPSGRMTPETVLWTGLGASVAGLGCLALWVNPLTAALGAFTLASYLFVYTPLKRLTPMNTVVGAVPGALPPLLGWTAARGEISVEGWALFSILFFWQLPHFLAIAWIYREDYARGGFAMLPLVDPAGRRTGRHALVHTVLLAGVSLVPFWVGLSGPVYLAGALVLGSLFLAGAAAFSARRDLPSARRLFYASLLYLPLLLGLMVFDRVTVVN